MALKFFMFVKNILCVKTCTFTFNFFQCKHQLNQAPRLYKNMLSSAEHEILNAYKFKYNK